MSAVSARTRSPYIAALLVVGLIAALLVAGPVREARAQPPAGAISKNVKFIANIPEMASAIAVNFIDDTMFVSTTAGLYAYSVSDPEAPELLGALPMYIWENEDMDVDARRNLVFISRDPRGYVTPVPGGNQFPYGGLHIIDASNPHALVQLNFIVTPAGHTGTCINDCDFMWQSGPAAPLGGPGDWTGRPVYGIDITDPMNPVQCPEPIDTERDNGVTAYAHDVQVDAMGIAWVAGQGGVRGYWTEGKHRNPLTGKIETATGCEPIPYAGGGTPESATASRFMHNSWRNLSLRTGPGQPKGNVLFGTEEALSAPYGVFAAYDLRGSYNGEGWRNIEKTKFNMKVLDTWKVDGQKGSTGGASAHYFQDRGDGILAYSFYGQGTRFIDATNPRDLRQIGYYRPDAGTAWAPYWHDGYVFIADNDRGIDILKFKGGPSSKTVKAPVIETPELPFEMDPKFGFLCPKPF